MVHDGWKENITNVPAQRLSPVAYSGPGEQDQHWEKYGSPGDISELSNLVV